LENLYDVTIAYRDDTCIPSDELSLVKGSIPREVHCHVTKYPVKDLPSSKQGE